MGTSRGACATVVRSLGIFLLKPAAKDIALLHSATVFRIQSFNNLVESGLFTGQVEIESMHGCSTHTCANKGWWAPILVRLSKVRPDLLNHGLNGASNPHLFTTLPMSPSCFALAFVQVDTFLMTHLCLVKPAYQRMKMELTRRGTSGLMTCMSGVVAYANCTSD